MCFLFSEFKGIIIRARGCLDYSVKCSYIMCADGYFGWVCMISGKKGGDRAYLASNTHLCEFIFGDKSWHIHKKGLHKLTCHWLNKDRCIERMY